MIKTIIEIDVEIRIPHVPASVYFFIPGNVPNSTSFSNRIRLRPEIGHGWCAFVLFHLIKTQLINSVARLENKLQAKKKVAISNVKNATATKL